MKTPRATLTALTALTAALAYAVPAHASPQATITGTFADGCRDFTAHSTKDISHVELHYSDGRIAKDEAITTPDHAVDGGTGDEIDFAVVKSGRTTKQFPCDLGSPPIAVLEIRLSPNCQPHTPTNGEPFYWCIDGTNNAQRTVFVDPGDLNIDMVCVLSDPLCVQVTLRGTGSTDPDGDISSWSIDFADGAVAEGGWTAVPPNEVTHDYALQGSACMATYCHITLTVTDSNGRSDTDSLGLVFVDGTPD